MKIIYNCYGGAHSSVTAAAIHLGWLPETRLPTARELLNLPYYDAQKGKDHGKIRFLGLDCLGNEIYIVGKKNLGSYYEKIMRSFILLSGKARTSFFLWIRCHMSICGWSSAVFFRAV